MSLRNEDNNTTITPGPRKRLNNITYNRFLRKLKRKTYAKAIQSQLKSIHNCGCITQCFKIFAESGKRSVDLDAIKKILLNAEVSKLSEVFNTPSEVCADTSLSHESLTLFPAHLFAMTGRRKRGPGPWNTSNTWLKFSQIEGIFLKTNYGIRGRRYWKHQ